MNTNKYAAAYIRRSSASSDSPGDASREAQLAASQALAALHAPEAELREYVDWGISGRRDDRPRYVELKRAIAAGQVCCVFAYSLSRLGRSNGELDAFFRLCAANDVTVFTKAEGPLGKTSAMGGFLLTVMSAMAELESELAKERSAAARAARMARGDKFGQPPMGYHNDRGENGELIHVRNEDDSDLQAVLDAYREAGTFLGAGRLLADRGVKSARGHDDWSTSAVRRIIEREMPEAMPPKAASGIRRRNKNEARLARLVVCHCGRVMTPNTARGQYYCSRGNRTGLEHHGRYSVTEESLMPFVEAQAAKFQGHPRSGSGDIDEARREALLRQKDDLLDLLDKGFSAERIAAKAATIDAELERIANAERQPMFVVTGPPDFAKMSAGEINEELRSIWTGIRLDKEMQPIAVDWSVPAYYYDADALAAEEARLEEAWADQQEKERQEEAAAEEERLLRLVDEGVYTVVETDR